MSNLPARRQSKRDEQVRRFVRRLRALVPHLDNPIFLPALQSFARIHKLLDRSYGHLREGSLLNQDGELRTSIDAVRRLAETHSRLSKELGITPTTLHALAREKSANFDLAAEFAKAPDDAETD